MFHSHMKYLTCIGSSRPRYRRSSAAISGRKSDAASLPIILSSSLEAASPSGSWMMMKARIETIQVVRRASRIRRAMYAIIGPSLSTLRQAQGKLLTFSRQGSKELREHRKLGARSLPHQPDGDGLLALFQIEQEDQMVFALGVAGEEVPVCVRLDSPPRRLIVVRQAPQCQGVAGKRGL